MKNPHIVSRLIDLMTNERETKRAAITAILEAYRAKGVIIDEFDLICKLWELRLDHISDILACVLFDLQIYKSRKLQSK